MSYSRRNSPVCMAHEPSIMRKSGDHRAGRARPRMRGGVVYNSWTEEGVAVARHLTCDRDCDGGQICWHREEGWGIPALGMVRHWGLLASRPGVLTERERGGTRHLSAPWHGEIRESLLSACEIPL